MIGPIIGIIIGCLIFGAGMYYLSKEGKKDPESKKIYSIISAIGAVIAVVALIVLIT